MKYLKLTNVPINLMNTSRYGGNGKSIPWAACGFNILMLRQKSVQVQDGENNVSYLPISDLDIVTEKLALILEDIADLDELSAEIIDAEYSDLVALRVAAQPAE